jgi:hypothetical protein
MADSYQEASKKLLAEEPQCASSHEDSVDFQKLAPMDNAERVRR